MIRIDKLFRISTILFLYISIYCGEQSLNGLKELPKSLKNEEIVSVNGEKFLVILPNVEFCQNCEIIYDAHGNIACEWHVIHKKSLGWFLVWRVCIKKKDSAEESTLPRIEFCCTCLEFEKLFDSNKLDLAMAMILLKDISQILEAKDKRIELLNAVLNYIKIVLDNGSQEKRAQSKEAIHAISDGQVEGQSLRQIIALDSELNYLKKVHTLLVYNAFNNRKFISRGSLTFNWYNAIVRVVLLDLNKTSVEEEESDYTDDHYRIDLITELVKINSILNTVDVYCLFNKITRQYVYIHKTYSGNIFKLVYPLYYGDNKCLLYIGEECLKIEDSKVELYDQELNELADAIVRYSIKAVIKKSHFGCIDICLEDIEDIEDIDFPKIAQIFAQHKSFAIVIYNNELYALYFNDSRIKKSKLEFGYSGNVLYIRFVDGLSDNDWCQIKEGELSYMEVAPAKIIQSFDRSDIENCTLSEFINKNNIVLKAPSQIHVYIAYFIFNICFIYIYYINNELTLLLLPILLSIYMSSNSCSRITDSPVIIFVIDSLIRLIFGGAPNIMIIFMIGLYLISIYMFVYTATNLSVHLLLACFVGFIGLICGHITIYTIAISIFYIALSYFLSSSCVRYTKHALVFTLCLLLAHNLIVGLLCNLSGKFCFKFIWHFIYQLKLFDIFNDSYIATRLITVKLFIYFCSILCLYYFYSISLCLVLSYQNKICDILVSNSNNKFIYIFLYIASSIASIYYWNACTWIVLLLIIYDGIFNLKAKYLFSL